MLDISDVKRLGALADTVRALDVPKLVIDHHIASDDPAGDVVLTDTTACATGELVYDLACALDFEITPAIAQALYAAMLTDTGGFRFSNTTPRCHAIAGRPAGAGVDPEEMYTASTRRRRRAVCVCSPKCWARLGVDEEHGLAWLSMARRRAGASTTCSQEDLDGIVEHARSIAGTRMALFFRDLGYGKVKVSFRSTGDVDVNAFARQFGGGGHAKASGALVAGSLDDVRDACDRRRARNSSAGSPAAIVSTTYGTHRMALTSSAAHRRGAVAVRHPRTGARRHLERTRCATSRRRPTGKVRLTLLLAPGDDPTLARTIRQALRTCEGVTSVQRRHRATRRTPSRAQRRRGSRTAGDDAGATPQRVPPRRRRWRYPNLGTIIAVSSGKGGVGKSTVAVESRGRARAAKGARVGLMDADVYGPNVPRMMGVNEPPSVINERIIPLEAHGVKLISLGFLIERDQPAIWRGPIVMKIITQFLRDVAWGQLDYFIVDMPPGTGDAQLSLVQATQVTGAIIVTTPQEVRVGDALRGVKMFERVNVPVLGIVENMSWFECPHCGKPSAIFGSGGGERLATELGLPLLGQIPLYPRVHGGRRSGRADRGRGAGIVGGAVR